MHRPAEASLSPEALLTHADFVRAIARSLLADDAAADDVVQDTMIAAMQRPPRVLGGLRGWLSTVARNFARQERRAAVRRTRRERAAAGTTTAPSAAEVHEREALRARVVCAVLALPDPYREVVLLRFYDERSPRAIAAALALPVETVRTRLKRGLERLRADLRTDPRSATGPSGALLALAAPAGLSPATATALFAVIGMRGVALAFAAAMLIVGALVWQRGSSAPSPQQGGPGPAIADAAREPTPIERQQVGATTSPARVLAGRVERPDGRPLLGPALLYVSPDGPAPGGVRPMNLAAATALRRADGASAVRFSEPGGAFRIDLGHRERAWVEVLAAGTDLPPAGAWFDAPDEGIVLRLLRAPTAAVRIRAEAFGSAVRGFAVGVHRADGHVVHGGETTDELLELQLPLTTAADGDEFELRGEAPGLGSTTTRVRLITGETQAVVLRFAAPHEVQGIVVDEHGLPVADALVYFGTFERLRGDEPFKPFRPARVLDGVRTDAAGHYALSGAGTRISVFHSGWTPTTVARTDAARVVLRPLGAIVGRLVDPAGRPRAGVSIALDREHPVVTDADGGFRFDGVFAGVRGLCLPERRYVGVAVRSGETAEVEIGRDLVGVRIRLLGVERAASITRGVALVGVGPITAVAIAEIDAGVIALPEVRPGRYWLIANGTPLATVELAVPDVEVLVEVGTATLTVRGEPGARVVVVPAGADELLRTIAARPSPTGLGADGTARFAALPPGDYEVVDAASGRVRPVQVTAPATALLLQ